MVTKTVRVTTTIQQRQQIVAMATKEPTWTHGALAKWAIAQFKLGSPIDRTTISKMLKRADNISSISGYRLKRSRTTSAHSPELEAELLCWLDKTNASEVSVTQNMVREEATRIARRQQIGLSSLTFSNGWLARFQARHCVKSRFDHGEAGSCDPVAVVRGRIASQDAISCYAKHDVYNLDEAALNYCAHSRRSIGRKGSKRGRKLNKQRVTVLLATNANGTDKLPLYFIGTAKKPKCFAGRPASHYGLSYSANAKGWMRSDLFSAWLRAQDDIFREQTRHVLLLMDNAPSHKTDGLELSNIKIHKLEPNTTPFNQPLDAGIIHAFKARFRQRRDHHAVNVMGSSTADSYKVDIFTGMQWATAAWRDVSEEAIRNCWKHTKVLPAPGLHEVEEQDLEYTCNMESDNDANSLCLLLNAVHHCSPMAVSFLLM